MGQVQTQLGRRKIQFKDLKKQSEKRRKKFEKTNGKNGSLRLTSHWLSFINSRNITMVSIEWSEQ